MRSYLALFSLSFLLSLALTPWVRRKALVWGAVAIPDGGRHRHARPTPRLGGVAIYLSFMATLACVPLLGNALSADFRASLPQLVILLAPATLIFLFGVYDDFRGAGAAFKFSIQLLAAALVYGSGFGIGSLSLPGGGSLYLPPALAFAVTALWIVGISNAFNLIDGIDGLAAGAAIFALLSILIFSFAQGRPEVTFVSLVLIGAVLGFLGYNFNPATIFLGDSGSLFLGFMAAMLSLLSAQKGQTLVAIAIPLISFGLPVTEVGLSIVRRWLSGKPLFTGDRGHIHHMLLKRGLTQRQAVILLYAVCAAFSLFGVLLLNPRRNVAGLIFFILAVGVIFGVQHLRYAEFAELGSQFRQRFQRGRRSLALNVRVLQTSAGLSEVKSREEFLAALDELLATNEFDCALLEVTQLAPGWERYAERCRTRLKGTRKRPVIWLWERGDTEVEEIMNSTQFWTLHVPLSDDKGAELGAVTFYRCLLDDEPTIDLKHLCGAWRRELSAALARLSSVEAKP